jgi:hypothetical protein
MPTVLARAPEQGQLVSVRSRNWIVNDVIPSTLPTRGLLGISDLQTLVSLACSEGDGLGEKILVVWELEPGARAPQIGPEAQAAVVLLNKTYGLSHINLAAVFHALFGITLTREASVQIVLRAADRLEGAHQEVRL